MMEETTDALKEVDRFHKNCLLLFEDLVDSIRKRLLADRITDIGYPDGWYQVRNANNSEHWRHFIFEHNDRIRFIFMLVKTNDEHLRSGQSHGFKAICHTLGVDAVFPLLLVTGLFEPRTIKRFREDLNLRRNWLGNTLLLRVPDNVQLAEPSSYGFDKLLTVMSQDGTDPWSCEKAVFKIRRLIDIKDSRAVETVVDDLITL